MTIKMGMGQKWFGRRASPDEHDKQYLLARRLGPAGAALPVSKTWRISPKSIDQGPTGTCVGHGWFNFLRCEPIQSSGKGLPTPEEIYKKAILLDEWADNDHEEVEPFNQLQSGTSVRAGAQAVMNYGRLKSYLWAFTLQPTLEFVLTQGPVVLGVNWYSTFNRPNKEGIVKITKASTLDGGHCFLWRGVDTRRGLALCENSWGDDWAIKGKFYIPLRDMEQLIHEDGEVCTAVEQKLKAA